MRPVFPSPIKLPFNALLYLAMTSFLPESDTKPPKPELLHNTFDQGEEK
jgi:hypothetical protein